MRGRTYNTEQIEKIKRAPLSHCPPPPWPTKQRLSRTKEREQLWKGHEKQRKKSHRNTDERKAPFYMYQLRCWPLLLCGARGSSGRGWRRGHDTRHLLQLLQLRRLHQGETEDNGHRRIRRNENKLVVAGRELQTQNLVR